MPDVEINKEQIEKFLDDWLRQCPTQPLILPSPFARLFRTHKIKGEGESWVENKPLPTN